MATEAGEGRKIYIELMKKTSSRMQQQILMSGSVRKGVYNGPRAHSYLRRRKEIQKRTGRGGRKVCRKKGKAQRGGTSKNVSYILGRP